MGRPDAAAWKRARAKWERGDANSAVGKSIGVTGEAVRRRARAEQWQRDPGEAEARAEARARQTEEARAEAKLKWAQRRVDEADAAGITAARARQGIVDALRAKDAQLVKAAAIAYGVLIDKAQLLSGDATSRVDDPTVRHDRARRVLDELAARRERTG